MNRMGKYVTILLFTSLLTVDKIIKKLTIHISQNFLNTPA